MRHARPAAFATALAAVAIAFCASAVLAECPPGPDDPRLDIGYAFIATVTEASADVGPAIPDNSPFDWHIELTIDRVYLGDVPDSFEFDGWELGCFGIRGDQLSTGDRLFILSEQFHASSLPRDPLWGDLLMWKRVDGRWAFSDEAIGGNVEDTWLTLAMRNPSSTTAILRIARTHPPDTATEAMPGDSGTYWLALGVVFAASMLVAAARYPRRTPARG